MLDVMAHEPFQAGLERTVLGGCWWGAGADTHRENEQNPSCAPVMPVGTPALRAEPESTGPQGSGTQVRRKAWNTSLDDAKRGSER